MVLEFTLGYGKWLRVADELRVALGELVVALLLLLLPLRDTVALSLVEGDGTRVELSEPVGDDEAELDDNVEGDERTVAVVDVEVDAEGVADVEIEGDEEDEREKDGDAELDPMEEAVPVMVEVAVGVEV